MRRRGQQAPKILPYLSGLYWYTRQHRSDSRAAFPQRRLAVLPRNCRLRSLAPRSRPEVAKELCGVETNKHSLDAARAAAFMPRAT